jgi:hypothetical protein
MPYYLSMLNRAQDVSQGAYPAYPGQLVANTSPLQQQAINTGANASGLQAQQTGQGIGNLGAGAGLTQQAGQGALGLGQSASGLASIYSPENVQQWMNPYQQGVTDIAKQQANVQFGQQQNAASAQAASHGALGGYRDQLRGSQDQFNQNTLLNNIQMQGGQQGFNTALQAMGQQGQLAQGAQQLGLSGYGLAGLQGQNLANIGGQQANMGQQGINNLQTLGALEQTQQQNQLNAAYNQFQNAQAYPQQQLGFLSGILRGLPVSPTTDAQTFQAPPSVYGQLAGIGMAGAGLGSLANKIGQ